MMNVTESTSGSRAVLSLAVLALAAIAPSFVYGWLLSTVVQLPNWEAVDIRALRAGATN